MKKLLLLLTVIFGFSSVQAQDIQIFNTDGSASIINDTITFWHAVDPNQAEPDFSHSGFAKIVNNTSTAMTIRLKRIEHQIISGSKDYLCWGQTCFGAVDAGSQPSWDVNDEISVNPTDTAGGFGLVVYLQANDNTGTALYEFQFYNKENPSITSSTYVKWSISPLTEINEIAAAAQNFKLYPNPATDQFTLDLNAGIKADQQEVLVRDLLGKTVLRKPLNGVQEKINFSTTSLEGGIYFVSYAVQGEILKTKKLVIK